MLKEITQIHRFFHNLLLSFMGICLTLILIGSIYLFYTLISLPNINELKDAHLQVPLKIYSSDDKLIGEFGEKRRSPIALSQVPPKLIAAILDTEDQRYYEHSGVDFIGLMRATKVLISTGKKSQGASTITMQVARNFFLTRRKTFSRKIEEMLLALKIDHALTKNTILELYLNKIYLGQRAYGVAAAAQVYYGKPLDQLTLAQIAMVAGLPQAPSRDNPITNPSGAKLRRDHVLKRMYEHGDILFSDYQKAIQEPETAKYHGQKSLISAPYIAEMVRSVMLKEFGHNVYEQGYKVYTTINSNLQQYANKALHDGILAYSLRHGYIGPEANWGKPPSNLQEWREKLDGIPVIHQLKPAAVLEVGNQSVKALLANGNAISISWQQLQWAKPRTAGGYFGLSPKNANEILKVGDIIRVKLQNNDWELKQIPQVNGALIAIDPNNGSIIALAGGFSFQINKFNCAIDANRQPGSNFKPFIYSAALAKGYTMATMINDMPIVLPSYGENQLWRPENVTKKFYGPTRLKVGLIESRNLVSIRLLQMIGIPYAIEYIQHFGFNPQNLPHTLSLALGTATITPVNLAASYAVFANGGYRVMPNFISHIIDEDGKTVYQNNPPIIPEIAQGLSPTALRVITDQNAYLMTQAMRDVIRYGTGKAALVLNRNDLAGKTGTTNQQLDAWFSGFNSDLVATVWVGFNQPQSLHEYGAQAALPIWIDFMREALKGKPEHTMEQPQGIITVRIDKKTGLLARAGQKNVVFEKFQQQYAPKEYAPLPDTNSNNNTSDQQDNSMELF